MSDMQWCCSWKSHCATGSTAVGTGAVTEDVAGDADGHNEGAEADDGEDDGDEDAIAFRQLWSGNITTVFYYQFNLVDYGV